MQGHCKGVPQPRRAQQSNPDNPCFLATRPTGPQAEATVFHVSSLRAGMWKAREQQSPAGRGLKGGHRQAPHGGGHLHKGSTCPWGMLEQPQQARRWDAGEEKLP